MPAVRRHLWLFAILALVAPAYFFWTWTGQVGQFGNDGPNYLMMALHYSPYAHTLAIYDEAAAVSRFPPLYPIMLAWAGAGADLHRVHAVTTVFLMAALAVFYAWLSIQGARPAQAALLLLLTAALPGSWLLGLSVQSEYLYLFWSLLALALLSAHRRKPRTELLYAAALAVAAAALTRTIGVTLYLPLLLAARHVPRRNAVLALLVAALPMLIWHLLHRATLGYTDALGGLYGGRPLDAIRAQLAKELPALRNGFIGNFMRGSPLLRPAADALGALCLAAALWRTRRGSPEAVYIAAYLGILLFWPYPEEAERFVWELVPLLLAQPLLLLAEADRQTLAAQRPQLATAAAAAVILALILPALSLASDRYRNAAYSGVPDARGLLSWYGGSDLDDAVHRVFSQVVIMDAMRRIDQEIPAGDCVAAMRPDLINYFSRRRSAFLPINSIPDPYFQKILHAPGCRFVFTSTATDGRYPIPLHPMQRLGNGIRVLDYVDLLDPPPGTRNVVCILAEID
ncbi:MAG: hypothetical protein ISP90_14305 [Nevskia sp.]|nr:hypothetical protein [Nevskia sp.]